MKVRILGLSCAYRNEPDVAWLVRCALKGAEKFGKRLSEVVDLETEFVDLADKEIKPCGNCERPCIPVRGLSGKGESETPQDLGCIIKDDYVPELLSKVRDADGFVFGSSVSNFSYSTKFGVLTERLTLACVNGYLTDKPCVSLSSGHQHRGGGQLSCLGEMNTVLAALKMLPVGWGAGAAGWGGGACLVSGPPFTGRKDYMGINITVWAGRKVAEYAVMTRVAKQKMGALYDREFMRDLCPPAGGASWWWSELDEEDEKYMMSLEKADIMKLEKGDLGQASVSGGASK